MEDASKIENRTAYGSPAHRRGKKLENDLAIPLSRSGAYEAVRHAADVAGSTTAAPAGPISGGRALATVSSPTGGTLVRTGLRSVKDTAASSALP